jgi:hypothetical protein
VTPSGNSFGEARPLNLVNFWDTKLDYKVRRQEIVMRHALIALCVPLALAAPAMAQGRSASAPSAKPLTFGVIDGLKLDQGTERSYLPLAPIEKDRLALSWRPGGKWGVSVDLTSRSRNQVLPTEELAAGAYYQVTPRLRFGGGLTLNGDSLRSAAEGWKDKAGEAGVRIESAFSF